MTGITMDSITYDVRPVFGSLKRAFDFTEGENAGVSKYGTEILDTIGTKYTYSVSVEPNQSNPTAYDSFYEAISNPNRVHAIVMPYGQTTLSFSAKIEGGEDAYKGKNGSERWEGLSLKFTPMYPQVLR